MDSPIAIAQAETAIAKDPVRSDAERQRVIWRRLVPVALAIVDFAALLAAFYASWHLRYELHVGGDVEAEDYVPYAVYSNLAYALAAVTVVLFQLTGLYRLPIQSVVDIALSVFRSTFFGVWGLFVAAVMLRYPASSRLTFIFLTAFAFLFPLIGRWLVNTMASVLHRKGIGVERVLVVGDSQRGRMVMQGLAAQGNRGYQVVGFLTETAGEAFGRFRALGTVDHLAEVIDEYDVTQVIIALPPVLHERVLTTLDECRKVGLTFKVIPDMYEMRLSLVDTDTVLGIPLIGLREVSIEGWNRVVKRAIDVAVSALALLVASPLMVLIALIIKLESPRGPVIFRHTRIGKDGAPFTMFKFRSMRPSAADERPLLEAQNEAIGPLFKIRQDPRLTRVGRFIRRYSVDELPQLVNVLRGDMSLVGPRPPIPSEVEEYEDWHKKRLAVSPGMTGLWQVSGRSELDFDEMVMYDIYYIEHWSLSLDFRIFLRTIPTVLSGGGAF
jgi:exopolysaccharide biosynthesis polyprenyl glycosylphosphotransferase